ncbi:MULTISPECIES: hypothetical protein [Streptomyces]|uniref:Uncharacterized protein n=1 Tax=Streptomyces solicathayae TaxID=3081768 RepID=A0ABZ0M469_9ACTN|nr:hypothetical protein [Streptomyces sp. HUAS YS2]WOX26285.1 hypothetical protein R2D22_34850 [Streptomyces sp. HUAS YS2]
MDRELSAEELVPLLGDADDKVRRRAVRAFRDAGDAAVPVLLRVRRAPATGPRVRATALEALAGAVGPAALDESDREALRRLTRIRRIDEAPEPMHVCGSWFAVPTADRGAVLDAFDLAGAEPVTLRTGAGAWTHDLHDWGRQGDHLKCARVFVSPVLDGWTLVFGKRSEDAHALRDAPEGDHETVRRRVVEERCAELGRRFGRAQWYGMSCGDGWTAWCVAEGAEVVRYYDAFGVDAAGDPGPRHPAEAGFRLPHEPSGLPLGAFDGLDLSDAHAALARVRRIMAEHGISEQCAATDIAERLSVSPAALGPHTRIEGQGVLALTACGREHGHPPGALPF